MMLRGICGVNQVWASSFFGQGDKFLLFSIKIGLLFRFPENIVFWNFFFIRKFPMGEIVLPAATRGINSMKIYNILRAAQNLLHCPALRQLIHQLVQIPNLLGQRILDLLDADPADHPGDEACIGV